MKEINDDFIKDTATIFADMQSDEIKLNYKDGVYYGYLEGFRKALELVKNNGVLDDVSKQSELLKAFEKYLNSEDSTYFSGDFRINEFLEDFNSY